MIKFGFIVEGHLESDLVSHICKGAEVRRLRINGKDFPIDKIVDRIAPHIIFLFRKVERVFVVVDREQREISSQEMEQAISDAIKNRGLDINRVVVSVPDRNFESWIGPFVDDNCVARGDACRDPMEGMNGKAAIRSIFRGCGKNYVEVIDGVKLFKSLVPDKVASVSESFGRFYQKIDNDCWWKGGTYNKLSLD